jgi:GTP cyclohydrolase IA
MPDKLILTHEHCRQAVFQMFCKHTKGEKEIRVYGVPRGGIPVAYLLSACNGRFVVVDDPVHADWFVDDIIDSGKTRDGFAATFGPEKPFIALADHLPIQRKKGQWVVFPWEQGMMETDESATDIPVRLLQYIGEDVNREGLKETPHRFLKAWKFWTSGYGKKPADVLKVFRDGAENYDEMLFENNLPFYSMCEHHLAPFFGTATIAYIPDRTVCGLSKIHRVLDIFARRLQMQERLTSQVADALMEHLKPLGCGVVIKARHLCKESRGIGIQGSFTTTSALRGKFFDDATVRAEFLNLAK